MKFSVFEKWLMHLLPSTIFVNLGGVYVIIMTALYLKESTFMLFFFIVGLVLFNVYLFTTYQVLMAYVIFEKDVVKCTFLKRVRRIIPFKEIKDYGIFWVRGIKYIFISKIVLSEFERNVKAFELYKKTKNVIVFQYNEKAMNFIKEHIII